MNWALQAGGMITRTVKGTPDEAAWRNSIMFLDSYNSTFKMGNTPGYLFNYTQNAGSNWSAQSNVLNKAKSEQWVDTEPDRFSFNINGNTGIFYIGEDGKIYCQSSPGIKIEIGDLMQIIFPDYLISPAIANISGLYQNNVDVKISGFKITLPDGMQYEFGYYGINQSDDPYLVETSVNFFNELYYGENWNTWLLQKITSPNGYQVTFHYEPGKTKITDNLYYYHPISTFYRTVAFEKVDGSAIPKGIFKLFGPIEAHSLSIYDKYDGEIIFPAYLSTIETPSQRIDFSISKTQELRYDYLTIASDLASQIMNFSWKLHCLSPRSILAPYQSADVDCYIQRPDMDMLYWHNNSSLVYSYIANYIFPNSTELFYSNSDYNMYEGLDFDLFQWFKLDQIGLYSKTESKYLKKWNFSYNSQSDERLMLLSLQEIGENDETKNPYTFEYEDYYGSNKYSGTYKLPAYNSFLQDHWGYYNNTNSRITSFTATNMNGYYNQRNTSASYLYTGNLNKINYPLGGSVEFTYEPNQFSTAIKRNANTGNFEMQNHSTPVIGGGLRIKKIEYKNEGNVSMEKDYVYFNGIMGHEIKYYWPDYKGKLHSNPNATYTRERFVSQNLLPLCGGLDYSVSYPQVDEVISELGKIEYYYSNHITNPDENFINTIDEKKSISSPFSSKDFERGKLLRKITKNASETIVKKENHTYSKNNLATKEYIPAVATKQFPVIDGWAIEGASYKIYTYPYNLTSVIDSIYDTNRNNPVVTETDYLYNSCNFIQSVTENNSVGKKQTTKLVYPSEIMVGADTAVMRKMTDRNILSDYIERVSYLENGKVLDGKYLKYKEFYPGIFKPERIDLLPNEVYLSNLYPIYSYYSSLTFDNGYAQPAQPENISFTVNKSAEVRFDIQFEEWAPPSTVPQPSDYCFVITIDGPQKYFIKSNQTGLNRQTVQYDNDYYHKTVDTKKIVLPPGNYMVSLTHTVYPDYMYRRENDYFLKYYIAYCDISYTDAPATIGGHSALKPEIYYKYDKHGNITESKMAGSEVATSYLWGYNSQYPIAEIRNVSYSEVTSKISETSLKTIAEKSAPSESDWTTISSLRTSLPHAFVTINKYTPLIGIIESTDPKGFTIYYDYDTFGRLKETYYKENGVEKTIQSYDYHYKN